MTVPVIPLTTAKHLHTDTKKKEEIIPLRANMYLNDQLCRNEVCFSSWNLCSLNANRNAEMIWCFIISCCHWGDYCLCFHAVTERVLHFTNAMVCVVKLHDLLDVKKTFMEKKSTFRYWSLNHNPHNPCINILFTETHWPVSGVQRDY